MQALTKVMKPSKWMILPALMIIPLVAMLLSGVRASDSDAAIEGVIAAGAGKEDVVVARVNGKPISETALLKRIYNIETSPITEPEEGDNVRQAALDRIIRDEVLLIAAESLGLAASREDASAFASDQLTTLLSSDDPNAQKALELSVSALGVPLEASASDARVIELFERYLTLGAVYEHIRAQLPAEQQSSPQALEAGLDDLAAEYYGQVEIEIVRP